jgi:hypothetical protein
MHWSAAASSGRADDAGPTLEDTFIPAGESPPPDLTYRQPLEPAFQVAAPDTPLELLKPIADFHAGLHGRDWARMASSYPYLDRTTEERAHQLRDQYLSHDFGRWVYVRRVDSWWCEGDRACVVVRGVEHTMPEGDKPARNEETVVTYGLRRFEDRWIIATWSQGWPRYGSVPKLPGGQSWRDIWALRSNGEESRRSGVNADDHTFTPGPKPNTVRAADGTVLTAPEGWALVPPGDAALTRRVKEAGSHWVVQEKKGRKTFSRGVWAPAATIDRIRAELEAERATEGYAKRKQADAHRRDKAQDEYVEDFFRAVLAVLAFHPNYADLAARLGRAVTAHATPVGSGTVARTKRIPVEQRAEAAVIAWLRHQTTGYDGMVIPRVKGKRREVRRMLARRSQELLARYRRGEPVPEGCPLRKALAGPADASRLSS